MKASELQISEATVIEFLSKKRTLRSVPRARLIETFARIPHERALKLREIGGPAWLLLIELDRLILKARGRNPIKLTHQSWGPSMSRYTMMRALRQLVAAGVILVEQRPGQAPLITHRWFPVA